MHLIKSITTTFSLPKWLPYLLVGFVIFLSDPPSLSPQQKVPVQTEQRDAARSVRALLHFVKSHPPVSQNGFLSEERSFPSLPYYSNSIEVCLRNRGEVILRITPIGISLLDNVLPRSSENPLFSMLG